jgi:hypothetical protein
LEVPLNSVNITEYLNGNEVCCCGLGRETIVGWYFKSMGERYPYSLIGSHIDGTEDSCIGCTGKAIEGYGIGRCGTNEKTGNLDFTTGTGSSKKFVFGVVEGVVQTGWESGRVFDTDRPYFVYHFNTPKS